MLNATSLYPEVIFVDGFPFMLRGFNGPYVLRMKNNEPEWYQDTKYYLYFIDIRPTIIKRDQFGVWTLKTTDVEQTVCIGKNEDFPHTPMKCTWDFYKDVQIQVSTRKSWSNTIDEYLIWR